jgi:hypothetical protein
MTFSGPELKYLATQTIGRLATLQANGAPQVSPVGFSYNEELGTIDIGGFNMSASQKSETLCATPGWHSSSTTSRRLNLGGFAVSRSVAPPKLYLIPPPRNLDRMGR